jgi:hypothetical protein
MRKLIALAAVGGALLVPAAAQASDFMDKYNAADEVERVASRRYHIDPFVSCRQIGSKTFTCSVTDFKGSCSYSGRASVRKYSSYTYRVTSIRVSKSCF